jgi:GcrA cell cycle regulator
MVGWTAEQLDWLRSHWAYPITELRNHLGRSSDSIYSKARDLGLPSKKSLRVKMAEPPRVARAKVAKPPRAKVAKPPRAKPVPVPVAEEELPPPPPPRLVHPLMLVRNFDCRWPIGDPGRADFHFCRERVVEGKSYCLEHCQRAYTGVRVPKWQIRGK